MAYYNYNKGLNLKGSIKDATEARRDTKTVANHIPLLLYGKKYFFKKEGRL